MAPTALQCLQRGHIILVLILLTGLFAQPQRGAPSSMFHSDAQHTGVSPYAGPQGYPAPKWSSSAVTNNGVGAAIGADGTVFFGATNHNVYAVDGATGAQKWQFTTLGTIYSSPAIGNDGTVYVGSTDSKMYALDGATGNAKWNFTTGAPIYSSPVIGPTNTIYFGSNDANLYAVDGATGAQVWQFPAVAPIRGSPALDLDGNVYVVNTNSVLFAVSATTGAQLWNYSAPYNSYGSPAIGGDGTVYFTSASNVYGVKAGALVWSQVYSTSTTTVTPALSSTDVYMGFYNGYLYAYSMGSLNDRYIYFGPDMSSSSPTIGIDGQLYLAVAGALYSVNTTTMSVTWSYSSSSVQPATPAIAADGSLVAGSLSFVQASASPTPSVTRTPSSTSTPSNTPYPSQGAIQAVDVASLIGSQSICGNDGVVPTWLYGVGLVQTPTPSPIPSGSPLRPSTSFGGMTANAQLWFERDGISGDLQSVSVTCQALSFQNSLLSSQLLRYATAADVFNSSGTAYGTCSAYEGTMQGSAVIAYSVCEYPSTTDPGTCTRGTSSCTNVIPFTQSKTPPRIPQCADNGAASVVPTSWQGHGLLAQQHVQSDRFPADVLVIDGASISFAYYGTNPLQEASPNAYGIGAATIYCIESATAVMVGQTVGINLVIPSFVSATSDCIFGSLQPGAYSVPIFYYGTLQGGQCIAQAGSDPLPWQLNSWTAAPAPAAAPALSPGGTAAVSTVAAVAVLGAAVAVWMYRSGRFRWSRNSRSTTANSAYGGVSSNETTTAHLLAGQTHPDSQPVVTVT